MEKIIRWWRKKIWEKPKMVGLFFFLVFLSAFFRFYHLGRLTIFLDDQGRDVLKAAQILKEGKVPFIGPMASIGNLYLGPLYYWAITPFLWVGHFHPVAPVVFVALLSLLANIFLFFFLGEYFDLFTAFAGAFLYALSPLILQNSRFSWNPNPMPFFSLFWLWSLLAFLRKEKGVFIFLAGLALGILIQLHYVSGILIIFTVLAYLCWLVRGGRKVPLKKKAIFFLLFLAGFFLPLIPFILFEIKNCFINTRAAWDFIFRKQKGEPRLFPWTETVVNLIRLQSQELLFKADWLVYYFWLVLLAPLFFISRQAEKRRLLLICLISVFWLSLAGAALVIKGKIHLHYLGFLNPFVFIFIGASIFFLRKLKGQVLSYSYLLFLVYVFLMMAKIDYQQIVKAESNHQIEKSQLVADYIAQKALGKNIYVASLTGSPYAYNFRYFLYLKGFKTDSLQPSAVFAICEGGPCHPEGNPLWEIAQFGVLKTVSGEHVAYGVWVYKLMPQKLSSL